MAFEKRATLPGSDRTPPPGAQPVGSVQEDETVRVSLILRRKADVASSVEHEEAAQPLTHELHEQRYGAEPGDVSLVEQFAHEYGLTVVEASTLKRRVILSGTPEDMRRAFGVEFICYRFEGDTKEFRGRIGPLSISEELQGIIRAVLGLDARPVAKPHFRQNRKARAGSFTPPQIAPLYNFPKLTGEGQTVAIIELGGGYRTADLNTYFKNLGLPVPNVTAVSVDGGKNTPGSDADGEVMLDIEVVGAIATGAKMAVYFAPNTDQGFVDAITNAVHDTTRKPSVISISWGAPEDSWTQQARDAMNSALQDAATLGVTVTAAAGDDGSTDGASDNQLHVDFPASSPYSLACGGTTLKGSGTQITSEVVWNEIANKEGATGGGVSKFFPLPAYQKSAGVPKQGQNNFVGRGVPDVAGHADPVTGYQVRVNGQDQVIGGTSAVAPLWAALVALLNQQLGKPVGFLNPKIYAAKSGFRDIITGNNDDSSLGFYKAGPAWDACTGLGSPNGTALLTALSSTSSGTRVSIPGSSPAASTPDQTTEIENPDREVVTATIVLRRAGKDLGDELLSGHTSGISPRAVAEATSATQADVDAVTNFARASGLQVVEANAASRTVKVEGTVSQMNQAFGVSLQQTATSQGGSAYTYSGPVSIPASLEGIVTSVLGLDSRPVAKHHTRGGN
jgi:kumamolisin